MKLGATDVVDPSKGDPVEQVKALTGGRGADYAFEVIGLPETILTTYNLARRGGEVIIVGMARFDAQFTLPAFGIFFEQKTVKGCKYGSAQVRRDFPRFVELIETDRLDISLDGVEDHQARGRQRRLPRHGSGRGHPQRHRLTRQCSTGDPRGAGPP